MISPKQIKDELDKIIIGQERAKILISVAMYNNSILNLENTPFKKTNILIHGPTGSGKTLLIENLCKLLDKPYIIFDSSKLTQTGYSGESVEDIFSKLLSENNYNISLIESSIIYLDEFDKISEKKTSSKEKDIAGAGVQYELLKVLEGTSYSLKIDNNIYTINTHKMTFICGGAFAAINNNKKADGSSFVEYGLIPELVGRFNLFVEFEKLSENSIYNILTLQDNSILKKYEYILLKNKCKVFFDPLVLKYIAKEAFLMNFGARSLEILLEKFLSELTYKLLLDEEKEIFVDRKLYKELSIGN